MENLTKKEMINREREDRGIDEDFARDGRVLVSHYQPRPRPTFAFDCDGPYLPRTVMGSEAEMPKTKRLRRGPLTSRGEGGRGAGSPPGCRESRILAAPTSPQP